MVRAELAAPPLTNLEALLAQAARDSAEFPHVLANHLPMILVALTRLGAGPDRLAAYAEQYSRTNGLVPMPRAIAPITRDDWTAHLGDRSREADYRSFFTGEVMRLGIRDALAAYMPDLVAGVAASALHPLMRLAYAILRQDPAETGVALGYWAACFLPLRLASDAPAETDDPGSVLAAVTAMEDLRALPPFDHLWYAMRATAAEPAFASVVDRLRIDAGTPRRVAATALALFAATMDFSALHAVTGSHWVRIVASVWPDPRLMRYFWQAVAALVPSIGFPSLPDAGAVDDWRQRDCPEWPAIMAVAVASADEHDISLVFSASEEERVYGDRLYRVVAARRVGLVA